MLARIGLLLSAGVVAAALAAPAEARQGCGFRWHLSPEGVCVPNSFNFTARNAYRNLLPPPPPEYRVVLAEGRTDRAVIVRQAPRPTHIYDPGSMTMIELPN